MGPRLRLEFSVYVAFTNFFVVDGYELSERHGRIFRRARVGAGSALRCATRAPRAVVHGDRGLLLQWSWKRHSLLCCVLDRLLPALFLPVPTRALARCATPAPPAPTAPAVACTSSAPAPSATRRPGRRRVGGEKAERCRCLVDGSVEERSAEERVCQRRTRRRRRQACVLSHLVVAAERPAKATRSDRRREGAASHCL